MRQDIEPKKCNDISVKVSHDAHEHAHNISNWDQKYDQISAGRFQGVIKERLLDNLQVFKEHTSKALSQQCIVWPESIWLGIPPSNNNEYKSSKINGLKLNDDDIMCRPGCQSFELTTPESFDIFGIVMDQKALNREAHKQEIELNWHEISNNERLSIPHSTKVAMDYLLGRVLDTSNIHISSTPEHLTKDLLIMGLLDVFIKESPNRDIHNSYQRRKNIVDKARDFLNQHQEQAITLTELCEACHTSRRTLQNSFETILGLSPIQYLRYTRLNGVRRTLKNAENNEKIGDIAAKWGFWHLSQFAKDYKIVFEESPKDTLNIL
jgi:AraC family ethanolamine operon transcriptional activator